MAMRDSTAIIFFAIVAIFLILGLLSIHPFGDTSDINTSMDDHIIQNTQKETGADNGVTAVVFDYRGFDTLGEATVLFTAVAGVILVFRRLNK